MRILLFKSEQFGLFDMPVQVAGSVKKDGTVVKPHTRIQKVALKKPEQGSLFGEKKQEEKPKKSTRLDKFIEKHGGLERMASMLAGMTEGQQQRLFSEMAKLDGKTVEQVVSIFNGLGDRPEVKTGETPDLFLNPKVEETKTNLQPGDIIEFKDKLGKMVSARVSQVEGWQGTVVTSVVDVQKRSPFKVGMTVRKLINDVQLKYRPNQSQNKPKNVTAKNEGNKTEATPFGVPSGITKSKRREINAQVVDLIASGKTEFTDAEKALMRQYSGNGGCGDSLNEFYTDPDVATAMWTALRNLGFETGSVLEPSCATGVFLHTAPQGVKVTGVELDPISSKVAQVLHGDRHEVVNASLERFATQDGNRQFDVVIGNAPFGLRGSLIKDDKPNLKTAEAYFLDTALDKTKPGGLVAMIVPTGVLDAKSNRGLRERLLRKGEFLGAVRMPNTAFEHSHTEVTTDIVFMRKRADDVAGALMTVNQDTLKKLGVWDDEFLSGSYFEGRGASSVFGTMEAGWRAKAGIGQDITVSGSMSGVPDEISKWTPDDHPSAAPDMPRVLEAIGDDEDAKKKALGAALIKPYAQEKEGDTKVVDGVTYILQGNPLRWHRVDEFLQDPAVSEAQEISADIERLFTGQAVNRPELEAKIRAYVEKHGIPAKNNNLRIAASTEKSLYRLIGAVNLQGELSDAVTGKGERKVEGTLDAIAQSMAVERDSGTFTAAELAERTGKDAADVEDVLFASPTYAYAGDGQWTTMDAYLTGELWPKLDKVRDEIARGDLREGLAEKYAMQAKRLEETIDPKSLEDVEIMLNSAFLPTDIIAAYFNERKAASDNEWVRKQPDMTVEFKNGLYHIKGGTYDSHLLEKYLNRTGVRKDDMPTIDRMNEDFRLWLLGSRYRDQIEDLYNRKFRGFVQRDYSDAPIDIPGMNTEGLKQYQYSGLRWALAAGKGIIAADVGLGKTVRGLMLARMAKITGESKRPAFVVPKSVLANWVAEAEKWFPGSRVLVIGETYSRDKAGNLKSKSDSKAERDRKLHDLTQNDYDFVFISQPAFNDIDLDPVAKGEYIQDDFWVQRGDALGNAGDKRLNKIREAYNQAVAGREFQKRTDAIYFNDLGIDMMLVDEGHGYKNLYAARARFGDQPKFLGGQGLSNRALDMNLKTRWVREHNNQKGIFMLTATPTKNSPLEIYSMLSHIAPEAFVNIGIRNSEEFLDRFCEFKTERILGTDGTIQEALVTVGFKNLSELREIMRRYIDRKTAADVGLKLPERDDRMHLIDMTPEQQAVYVDLREKMKESANKKDATGDAHVFSIMDKMAKAAMDLELLNPDEHKGSVSPKYEAVAKNILNGIKEGGQVVFAEAVATHGKLRDALIKAGMKPEEIEIINAQEAETSAKRQNIADKFNAGQVKVVIGNTPTMGEGINLQKSTTDIHHLDLPWEPASMQQRNGRGLRQGNLNEAVRIHTYISKGSFDGYRYQSMTAKKDWQDILWNGGDRIDNLAREGVFNRDDLMIMMSADPEAERAKLAADKAAAQQQYDGEQRRSAASEFVRFQMLKRSYKELENKKTVSAERLRSKIERAKTMLANNQYFTAKGALDADTPVVIHPNTGLVLQRNVGLDITENDGSKQRWVVTSVNPTTGDVSMRKFGEIGKGALAITVPSSKLDGGVESFKFDEAEEAKHVAEKLETATKEKLNNLASWDDIKAMPSSVLEANHDAIQRQIKEGTKSYKFNMPYGSVPMMDKQTGKIKMAESYEHNKMHDTHDYLLPTDAAKEQAIQAWMESRRNAKVGSKSDSKKSGRGSRSGAYITSAAREYKDASYLNRHVNPIRELLRNLGPDAQRYGSAPALEKVARERLEKEQMQRIRRAKSAGDIMNDLMPLAKISGSNEGFGDRDLKAAYPKSALAMAWARARHLGQLDSPVDASKHSNYAFGPGGGHNKTVHSSLIRMARASGHDDLAEAMAATSERHGLSKNDQHTIEALTSGPGYHVPSMRSLEHIKKLAERLNIMDKTIGQLSAERLVLGGKFAPSTSSYYSYGNSANGKKFSDVLAETMKQRKEIDATKAENKEAA